MEENKIKNLLKIKLKQKEIHFTLRKLKILNFKTDILQQ